MSHSVIRVNLRTLGSGDLAGKEATSVAPVSDWWPFRNQMLVTLAAMRAITCGVAGLLIGTVKGDGQHADARREFIEAMDETLRLQEGSVTLEAPAIALTAVELVRESRVPWELLGWAHSCHTANYACGVCRGCHKHYHTWESLGAEPY